MISFDFEYYKPDTLEEASDCFKFLKTQNKTPIYYGGGTEIISMARAENIRFDAVIDLKGLEECNSLERKNGYLYLGSMLTLTVIAESGQFSLLEKTAARIADHTIQDKITLAGNLAGTIVYREAALPLMIANCKARIMTDGGLRELPFFDVFPGRLTLAEGEFLVQILVDEKATELPFVHVKRTRNDKIDYPLITLAATMNQGIVQAAVSGLLDFPVLLPADALNSMTLQKEERAVTIIESVKDKIKSDYLGSKEYREFVFHGLLLQMFDVLGGD